MPEASRLPGVAARVESVGHGHELQPLVAADGLSAGHQVLHPLEDNALPHARSGHCTALCQVNAAPLMAGSKQANATSPIALSQQSTGGIPHEL